MDWDVFWSVLFVLFIMIPLLMIWAFAIVDLFQRRDLRGIWKVVWLLAILIFPIVGTLIYFLVRPGQPGEVAYPQYDRDQAAYVTEKLTQLTDLRDKGVLTPEEYERQRSRLLGA